MSTEANIFPGSQDSIYAIAATGQQNCSSYTSLFPAYNVQYSTAYIQASATLEAAAAESTGLWQDLYVYINRSFDKTKLVGMRKLAGGEYYMAAAGKNWKAMDIMLIMASDFINRYKAELENGNMPAAFEIVFNSKKAAFEKAYENYSSLNAGIETAA